MHGCDKGPYRTPPPPPSRKGQPSGNPLREALRLLCPNLRSAALLMDVKAPQLEAHASTSPPGEIEQYLACCGKLGLAFRITKPRPLRFSVRRRGVDGLWRDPEFRKRCGLMPVPESRQAVYDLIRRWYKGAGRGISTIAIQKKLRLEWIPSNEGVLLWQLKKLALIASHAENGLLNSHKLHLHRL